MSDNTNLLAAMALAMNQLQLVKDKIDPEAYSLLQQSAHEAIQSAHHFLDACEKVIDSMTPVADEEIDLTQEETEEVENVVKLAAREG
jgi:hypothetical protein